MQLDYYYENMSPEDIIRIIENIENSLLENDYESGFSKFLLFSEKMSTMDRTTLIKHFKKYFISKYRHTVMTI